MLSVSFDREPVMRIRHKRGTRIRYSRTDTGDPVVVEIAFPLGVAEKSRMEGLSERIYALVDEHFSAAREQHGVQSESTIDTPQSLSFKQLCESLGRSAALRLRAKAA